MNAFELNKIAGAVLAAVLIIVASSTFIEIATTPHSGGEHEVVGYQLPEPEGEAATGDHADSGDAAAPAAEFNAATVAGMVADANSEKGAKLFKKCSACHTAEQGGADKVGPHLWGVAGRPKGSAEGFGYSDAMKAKGGTWDDEALVSFLHKPKKYVEGTKMVFAGFSNDQDLADIVAYLHTLK